MLSPEAIQEFKIIFEKTYHRKITDGEAIRRANNLIRLYKAVLCPILLKEEKKNIINKNI
jgi:hypothetical protein